MYKCTKNFNHSVPLLSCHVMIPEQLKKCALCDRVTVNISITLLCYSTTRVLNHGIKTYILDCMVPRFQCFDIEKLGVGMGMSSYCLKQYNHYVTHQ